LPVHNPHLNHEPNTLTVTPNLCRLGLALLLTACTVGPDYQKPDTALPKNWTSAPGRDNIAIEQHWWRRFNDPTLNRLIEQATTNNPDLQIAAGQIAEARALRAVAAAALMPGGNFSASANRQANQFGFPGGGASDLSQLIKQPYNIFKSVFDASWELDLFGGRRRDREAASAELEAAADAQRAQLISTLAEVAHNYIDIRNFQAQLDIADDTLAADLKTVELTRQRVAAGESAAAELIGAEARQQRDQSQIPYYRNQLAQAEYALDVLLGEQPGAAHRLTQGRGVIPAADSEPVLAAPAAVIANRPDIASAERKLAAATAQQGVAVAKFFPDVSLTGFIGLFNTNAGNFLNVSSKSWSMGGNLLWPILSYGSLSANVDAADAKQQQALARYRKSIISALSDVERAYTAYSEQQQRLAMQQKSTAADARLYAIALERYQQGLSPMLEALDGQRTRNSAASQLASAKAQTAENLIALYKSLGGGW
jgi:multidrug efflux system outer membrane protein